MSASDLQPLHLVVMGVSATGKTTVGEALAAQLDIGFVEGDSFHPEVNIKKMESGVALTDADRKPWLEALAAEIAERATAGTSVAVTCSALKRVYRDVLRTGADDLFFVHLHADFEVLQERMSQRTKHFMPPSLLRSQFDTLEPLEPDEAGVVVDVAPPIEFVVGEAIKAVRAHARR